MTAAEIGNRAIRQLIEAAKRLPERVANQYDIAEPLRVLADPENAAAVANFFGGDDDV